MMKRKMLLPLVLALMIMLTACGNEQTAQTTETVPVILNQTEYMLYQNVMFNGYGSQCENSTFEKQGVFASIWDAFNNTRRYYVWGYLDNTKCCDWQWEFVPKNKDGLPPAGSLIRVTGVFVSDRNALDGYWIRDAKVETISAYTGEPAELNMYTMSCTLERVQMLNISRVPEPFEGKEFAAYGRIAGKSILEDPYYNGSWQMPFSTDAEMPAFGTLVLLRGRVQGGALTNCSMAVLE